MKAGYRPAEQRIELWHLSDPTKLQQVLDTQIRPERLPLVAQAAVRQVIHIISQQVIDGNHTEATANLRDLGEDGVWFQHIDHGRLFALTRAARSVGLFAASGPIESAGLHAFGKMAMQLRGLRGHVQRARFGLAVGDVDRAAEQLPILRRSYGKQLRREILATVRYLEAATGKHHQHKAATTGPLKEIVDTKNVLVYGPGPDANSLQQVPEDVAVARVLMPGVTWDSAIDLAKNRVDVAYANGTTAKWLMSLDALERNAATSKMTAIVFKRHRKLETSLASMIEGSDFAVRTPSFLSGHPNMIPIMIWDLLLRGVEQVHVIGTSFFLGKDAYRANQRRLIATQIRKDTRGSTGNPFEVCRMLGKHNAIASRRFAANLLRGGRVCGDSAFLTALALPDAAYLAELDETYGVPRL